MSRNQSPAFTAAIVVYHSDSEVLQKTLRSLCVAIDRLLHLQTVTSAHVSILCNDDSLLQTSASVAELQHADALTFSVQATGANLGFGAAHNIAIAAAESDFHLILNPDVTLSPDALQAGIDYLRVHADISAVSPLVTDGVGKRQHLCKRYPAVLDLLLRGFAPAALRERCSKRLEHYEMQDLSSTEPTRDIPIISGCFMLFRTESLHQLHGFDPEYFLYFEDFDLSMRAATKGSLAFLPQMRIVHLGGHSARKGWRHIRLFMRSGVRFFNRWGWQLW